MLILFACSLSQAQQFKTILEEGKKHSLKLLNIDANIEIFSHDLNEILIVPSSLPKVPEKADGLRPLMTKSGVDNTGISLNMNITGDVITFSGGHNDENLTYQLFMPGDADLFINSDNFTKKINIAITGLSSNIEVILQQGNLTMKDIAGTVNFKINTGDVTISFIKIKQGAPMDMVCHKGDIDISFPDTEQMTFKLRAPLGDIYTDLSIEETVGEDTLSYDGMLIGSKDGRDLWTYRFDPEKRVELLSFDDAESIMIDKDSGHITITNKMSGKELVKKIYDFDWKASRDITNSYFHYNKVLSLQGSAGEWSFIIGQLSYDFTGKINGGGVEVAIRSEEGSIYLRKSR